MNNNGDAILEPIWGNDQVVMQSIPQTSSNEFDPVPKYDTVMATRNRNYYLQQQQLQQQQNLYMQEDEMTSWLHYPFPVTNFSNNFSEALLTDTKMASCPMNVTSSSGDATQLVIPQKPCVVVDDRKRKGKEKKLESAEAKKRAGGSTKRSRDAEVHNQSERRRRDRINQKLKALRELIPGSNKLDKASILEEAINYMKSLQMQVQMLSMVYNMVPTVFPGMQQYVPVMVMNHPILPSQNDLTGSLSTPPTDLATEIVHLGPSFAVSPYQIPPIISTNSPTTQSPGVSKS